MNTHAHMTYPSADHGDFFWQYKRNRRMRDALTRLIQNCREVAELARYLEQEQATPFDRHNRCDDN